MTKAAAEFRDSGAAASATADRLLIVLPELHRLAGAIDAISGTLEGSTVQQLKVIEALLGSVQVRGEEVTAQADAAIAGMVKQLAEVDEQSRQTTSRIAKRAYALDTAVDGASGRAVALLDAVGERVGAQMTVLDERLSAARANLHAVGEHGVEITGQRLDQLLNVAGEVSRLLVVCNEQGQRLLDTTDSNLLALPGRLANAQQRCEQMFEGLVAGQAKAIDAKIAAIDSKVEEMQTRLDVRARDTLSARSTRLVEMLNAASVDIARLLSIDAGENAWLRYLKGDRSIFARRIVRIVDRPTIAKIARHFTHDEEFRAEASFYLELFEKLSRRLISDPEGDTLLATIVSSDIGKLYVVIARATGRWTPVA